MATIMQAPLASVTDFTEWGSNRELVQDTERWTQASLDRLMLRASRAIENRCQRRLAPFSGILESHRAEGIDPDEYGGQADLAMDLTGALGWSQAAAMGVSDMVRQIWLDQWAPQYPELWSYTLTSLEILRTFGDTQTFTNFTGWQGPEKDTGWLRMPIGTYCPEGSEFQIIYSGGYTVEIPDDLNLATVLQAIKFVLLSTEPESRKDMNMDELDGEILISITPYVR